MPTQGGSTTASSPGETTTLAQTPTATTQQTAPGSAPEQAPFAVSGRNGSAASTTRTWIVRSPSRGGAAGQTTVAVQLGRLAGTPVAARGPIVLARTTLARRRSAFAAPSAAALLPSNGVLGARFEKTGRGFDAGRALLLADALFAIVLLGLAALPPRALANRRVAALVETRRIELALAGVATLAVAVLAQLVSGS